ncbi:hypothetical protein PFISCL1PPCAC_25031, partial [Pristionchus fissidentatus]
IPQHLQQPDRQQQYSLRFRQRTTREITSPISSSNSHRIGILSDKMTGYAFHSSIAPRLVKKCRDCQMKTKLLI